MFRPQQRHDKYKYLRYVTLEGFRVLSKDVPWKSHSFGGRFDLHATNVVISAAYFPENGIGGKDLGVNLRHQPIVARCLELPDLAQQNRGNGHGLILLIGETESRHGNLKTSLH